MDRTEIMCSKNTLFISIIILLMTVCSIGSASAYTLDQEIQLGKQIDAEITKQIPQSNDQAAVDEMNRLGQQIAKHVNRPQIKYHFRILDEGDDLDAFSIPGGYVYFSKRMWDTLNTDERTGVLGHEIAHVDRRHALDAMLKAQKRSIFAAVVLTVVGANRTVANLADMANSLYGLKYSRGDEQQADEVSVDLCQKAGLNPAGILLAMRKIKRFEDERGGMPPKILSTHPPTQERIQHLEALLKRDNISIPPEVVGEDKSSYPIGSVIDVNDNTLSFTSTKNLKPGDVVWLMGKGWDYKYENRKMIPIARAVVTYAAKTYTAAYRSLPTAKQGEMKAGVEVDSPPDQNIPENSIGFISSATYSSDTIGQLKLNAPAQQFERLLAQQIIWDQQESKYKNDNVGYLVVTNTQNEAGYVSTSRSRYSYVPMNWNSSLIAVVDKNNDRWVGPIISIGRSGHTIEIMPNKTLDSNKTYDVLYPAWNIKDDYKRRTVGHAKVVSTDKKIVLKMTSYSPGWDISEIQNSFDVYEQPQEKSEK